MVCLTTFGDTKWVISQSLIIFHTFYGYVQGRGVLSRGSAYLPPHSLHTSPPPHGSESSPFTQPGSLPNSSRSVIYFLWSDADFLISPAQPPASNCTEDNPGLPRCGAGERPFFFFFSVRFRNLFMSNMERGKKQKMKQRSRSSGAISCGRLTPGSCQLFTGSQSHIWIQCLWHLFKCFRN